MKLICLNIWGGKIHGPLMKFVREQAASTDIFCFQEVFRSPRKDIETSNGSRINILGELAAALPDFDLVFHPVTSGMDDGGAVDFEIEMGQAEFVKKSVPVLSSGEIPLYSTKKDVFPDAKSFRPRAFGYVRVPLGSGSLTVLNIHGFTFRGDDKLDRPERLEQSRIIKEFAGKESNPVLICGDLNVLPDVRSIAMLENSFVNLVRKYGISSTRSKISPWHGTPGEMKFSDYIFASPQIKVSDFRAPDPEISDHLPLILEFN